MSVRPRLGEHMAGWISAGVLHACIWRLLGIELLTQALLPLGLERSAGISEWGTQQSSEAEERHHKHMEDEKTKMMMMMHIRTADIGEGEEGAVTGQERERRRRRSEGRSSDG